jgi:hypothetical protein
VQELPVDTPNVDAGNNVIPNISYVQVLANGTVVVARTTALNFAGSGVTVTGSNGAATITISGGSSYGNSNVVTLLSAFGSNTVSTTGNITGGYILGNGSQLTGIAASYGNANVVANLAALGSNPVSTTGNVTGGNLLTGAQVVASGVIQTGTGFSTGGYLSVDGDTDLHKTTVTGNLSATGNVTASYVFGNGSQLTGLPATYGNANVVANLAALGSNPISTTGNITGGNILGGANVNATTHTGTTVSVSANVTGGNLLTGGLISATGNITGGNLSAVNLVINNITSDDSTLVSVHDGLQVYGNIIADNLGNVAAINLTGSSSNVLYGNGTFAPAAGGAANTGNVTFNDVNIIGTGNLNLQPNDQSSEYLNIYLTGSADIHVAAGGAGANVILGTDEQANVAVLLDGNVAIQAGNVGGTKTWNFDTAGNLTLPIGGIVYETNIPDGALSGSAIALKPPGGTTANQQLLIYPTANDGDHIHLTSGNLYTTELFLGSDNLYVKLANTGNVVINSNDGTGNSAQWTFGTNGNLTLPANTFAVNYANGTAVSLGGAGSYGNANVVANLAALGSNPVSTTGNITAGNFIGNGAALTNVTVSVAGNIVGTSSNVSLVAGSYTTTFDNTGNTVFANGTVSVTTLTASGNVTGGNILTGGLISATGNVSAAGNVTAANFFGNGNTLSNVATRFESSWTVPTGNSTQNFTVTANNTYLMWVDCNIPNGILTWNATATVTNTNVPVVGAQYAWVYNGGGTPIDFTSIPNQFVGTANTIVRSNVAPSATTNRFDFGLNNTSGGSVTVRYGWVAIS